MKEFNRICGIPKHIRNYALEETCTGYPLADIAIFQKGNVKSAICIVEVKRHWDKVACLRDMNRIRELVHHSAQHGGTLKHGFLALFLSARTHGNCQGVRGKMRNIRNAVCHLRGQNRYRNEFVITKKRISQPTPYGTEEWECSSCVIEVSSSV